MPRVTIHYNANIPAFWSSDWDTLEDLAVWEAWENAWAGEGDDPMVRIAEFFIPEHSTNGFGPIHFDTDEKLLRYLEAMFSSPGGYQEELGARAMDYGDTITIDGRTYVWAGPNDRRRKPEAA